LQAPFVYDDVAVIEHNDLIHSQFELSRILKGQVDTNREMNGSYRPLFLMFLSFLGKLFGFSPSIFRLFSFLLHALNGTMLFFVAHKIFSLSQRASWFVALLFVLHPIQVTNLALVWKQSDLWIVILTLSSFLFLYQSSYSKTFYGLISFIFFLIGLLIKESAVVMPSMGLMIEPLCEKQGRVYRISTGLACLAISFLHYHFFLPNIPRPLLETGFPGSRFDYLATQLSIFPYYLKVFLFPSDLTIDRSFVLKSISPHLIIVLCLLACGSLVSLLYAIFKKSRLSIAALIAILWLLPTSSFHRLSLLYDETRFYLVVGAIGVAFCLVVKKWTDLSIFSSVLLKVLQFVFVLTLVSMSFLQTFRWQSEESLWKAVLDIDHRSPRAYYQLGLLAQNERLLDEAQVYYQKAIQYNPNLENAHLNLGIVLGQKGDLNAAAEEFRKLLTSTSYWAALGHYHLGLGAFYRGDHDHAFVHFSQVRKLSHASGQADRGEAIVLTKLGKTNEAIAAWQRYLSGDGLKEKDRQVALREIERLARGRTIR